MIGGAPRHPFYLLGFLVILSILSSAILHVKAAGETTVPVTSYSSEEIESMQAQAEHHTFQAEVKQLLDILVNSLYSNKDVFLRELISNGSDALGKIRFQALTDPSALSTKHELAIYVRPDPARGILHIIDTGVGMTRAELVDNLGRIAKSGTKEFFSALQNAEDSSNLIGKFGVGFYSAFLVADVVRVTSKNNNDEQQWVWESTADGSFTVTVDPHGNTLGRGTQVSLVLKPGMSEYLDEDNLEALVHRYSEFINFPIYLWAPKDVAIEKPAQEEADVAEIAEDEEDAQAIEDDTEYETVWGYERVNAEQPLWTRDSSTITTEQYNSFYRSLTNELTDPLTHTHFTAEGDSVKFTSLLFVPSAAPETLYTQSAPSKKPIKLFVKRVFITDDFRDVMPKYLSFVHGIVDSDDLDLNVSREVLQQTKLLDTIQRKLVRKAIGMFQELAGSDEDKYNSFWREFGTSLKWGYLEDKSNKQRLEKLMRWESTTSGLTGLEGYVERMKEGQDQIFFISGQDKKSLAASPLLEKLNKRGLEVLFMTDPIDEYVTQILTRFDDFALTNIAKEGLKLGDEEDIDIDTLNDKFKPLLDFIKGALGPKRTGNVVLSQRLESVPSALVSGQWGWTANMERIVKSQALTDKSQINAMKARRILELNPTHPIVESLLQHIETVGADAVATNSAVLLYHSALLTSGFELEDPLELSQQLQRVLSESLVIDTVEQVVETHDKDEL